MKPMQALLIAVCTAASSVSAADRVEPEAVRVLSDVRDKLRSLDDYTVETTVKTKAAVGAGRYRDFSGRVQYMVSAPDSLAASVEGNGLTRKIFYDGKVITLYSPKDGLYAQLNASGNLETLVNEVKDRRGLDLPVAHIFAWNDESNLMSRSTRATYSGTGKINGRACEHYSYALDGKIWELHIDENALPCKLSMIDMNDRGLPGYSAEFAWNTRARLSPSDFQFKPAANIAEVAFSEIPEI